MLEDTVPRPGTDLKTYPSRCPSCGNYQSVGGNMPVANGDRILVLKCIYQFIEPKRWDVIVFKNPPEPEINYIKRLVGLPGETVQIIDGDIYVNGQISRKPPKVQDELWMPVYDNDYQPVNRFMPSFNYHAWEQPFKNKNFSKWEVYEDSPTLFHLNSLPDQISTMEYNASIGNDFRATYAYDNVQDYSGMPYCSDLMVRFYCNTGDPEGSIGISLSKYETTYRAKVNFSGLFELTKQEKGKEPEHLMEMSIQATRMNTHTLVQFANVDHQLIFQYGSTKFTHDLGSGLEDAGRIGTDIQPRVEISGSGKLTLSHVAVFRDIHYTTSKYANGPENGRAIDRPFTLEQDEYFVLGDNSPNSEDCRWWTREGLANKGLSQYRVGIVPRDYLVGKALFVYWPSGFRPFPTFPIGIIPNIGRMRFIYGGSNEKL
jgi:signal peptidase I